VQCTDVITLKFHFNTSKRKKFKLLLDFFDILNRNYTLTVTNIFSLTTSKVIIISDEQMLKTTLPLRVTNHRYGYV
jgi:hypothetical protein